jgi:uncharacterized protein
MTWIQVRSGRKFDFYTAQPADVDILDIATALSMQCRWNGQVKTPDHFVSVAEHSMLVSAVVSQRSRLWGLLHDGSEAYVADIPRPLKRLLPEYTEFENRVQEKIVSRFDIFLDAETRAEVHAADAQVLLFEARQVLTTKSLLLFMDNVSDWLSEDHAIQAKLHQIGLKFKSPRSAREDFLLAYDRIERSRW